MTPEEPFPPLLTVFPHSQQRGFEGGNRICYMFTRPQKSEPALRGRGEVVLSVAHRGPSRDVVAITAGYAFPERAELVMTVDATTTLAFYTQAEAAFARNGRAVVEAFQKGKAALSKAPGPKGGEVADTWSLKGFSAAYRAIGQACAR